jgi:hypothetical protein
MYPDFQRAAVMEHNHAVEQEMSEQIAESKEHAEEFKVILAKAEKRFNALKKVEERHANAYKQVLGGLQ